MFRFHVSLLTFIAFFCHLSEASLHFARLQKVGMPSDLLFLFLMKYEKTSTEPGGTVEACGFVIKRGANQSGGRVHRLKNVEQFISQP